MSETQAAPGTLYLEADRRPCIKLDDVVITAFVKRDGEVLAQLYVLGKGGVVLKSTYEKSRYAGVQEHVGQYPSIKAAFKKLERLGV